MSGFDTIWGWGLVFVITGLLMVLAGEVGFRLGRRRRRRTKAEADTEVRKSHVGVLVAAILALLGLLLAFSFSIVESRFGARKQLVLEEANAIGTTYLRGEMFDEPYRGRIESLLRDYVNVRLARLRTGAELERAIRKSEAIQGQLWAQAIELAHRYPGSKIVPLFVQSLNDVIDLHESRVTVGLYQRLPAAILWTLYIVSILSLGLLGYGTGLSGARSLLPTAALVVAITCVVVLIVELDRPGTGLFKVSRRALEDVRQTMSQTYHRPAAGVTSRYQPSLPGAPLNGPTSSPVTQPP